MDGSINMKQIRLNNRDAASLFKKYEAINQLGTGILTSIKDIGNSQQISSASILLSLDEIKKLQQEDYKNLFGLGAIYIKIQSSRSISIESINQLFQQLHNFKHYDKISHLLSGFYLEWYLQSNQTHFASVVRYLQHKSFIVSIEPHISTDNWNSFQVSLNNFSCFILENQNILLSCISLILAFPLIQSKNYSKTLLSIWRRVIPCGIGRIVLKKSNIQDYLSFTKDLFHVKGLPVNWKIQFLASNIENWQQLQQRVLGIA